MYINLKMKKYVLACSGGVDSMVLLDLLVKHHYDVVIAHFNHLTRGKDNETDYSIIKNYAKEHNLKVYYTEYNFKNAKENFHSLAHKKRYEFFYQVCQKEKADLLLAHHAYDLIETHLMNYLRGSSLKGYASFVYEAPFHEFKVYRPLIYFTKDDILDYAAKNNIIYNEDYSNAKDSYTRNRIRHHVIPLLLEENPALPKKALEYANNLMSANDYIEQQANEYLKTGLKVSTFKSLHPILKKTVIANTLKKHNINTSNKIINSIIALCVSIEGTKTLDLSNDYLFVKAYDDMYIKLKEKPSRETRTISATGDYYFENKIIHVTEEESKDYKNCDKICYNANINFLIELRHRKSGDILEYPFGHKKLKQLLIDKKINKTDRDKLLVICINQNIVYVEGCYKKSSKRSNAKLYLYIGDSKDVRGY